jgi:hypothetical protein
VGMLASKDDLQFSATSCTLEGMTLKLEAPGEHAFPRHTYYINLQVASFGKQLLEILKNLFKNPTSDVANLSVFFFHKFFEFAKLAIVC